MPSIVIPAHNEAAVLGRLLDQLLDDGHQSLGDDVEVTVVCNGCSDGTAACARSYAPRVRVLDLPRPSKHLALLAGDQVSDTLPRLYVDADVELTSSAAMVLFEALQEVGVHAVAPERELALEQSSSVVRRFYAQWQRLPAVVDGLYGRGVLGVDATGLQRIAGRPDVLGDDLYLHHQFAPGERRIVTGTRVTIHPPRTTGDLVRRRTRAAMGNREGARSSSAGASTRKSLTSLLTAALTSRRDARDVATYVSVTMLARIRARHLSRRADTRWLRDESSRESFTA